MGKLTRNSLPGHSLQALFHKAIKVIPGVNKRIQGLVMEEFRTVVVEPDPTAVRFAEAICEAPFNNEWGHCHQCGHGNNSDESHSSDCIYQQALKYLGRPTWVAPQEPRYKTRKVCALYVKLGMHLVVDECACQVKSISASDQAHPKHLAFGVVNLDNGVEEIFHFTRMQDVYIMADE